jgi:hypothetical protein
MQSEQSHDHEESTPPSEDESGLRAVVKAPHRDSRLSSDHIHLTPQAQRRMARVRRSGVY